MQGEIALYITVPVLYDERNFWANDSRARGQARRGRLSVAVEISERMGTPREPSQVKLVASVIHPSGFHLEGLLRDLESRLGKIEALSEPFRFDHTRYYSEEMGDALFRKFVVFHDPVSQDALPRIKGISDELESRYARPDGRRRVNVDPGILSAERFVLATRKNFTHRIYLGDGTFADLTLIACAQGLRPLDWTFPDYRSEAILSFLNAVRDRFLFSMNPNRLLRQGRAGAPANAHPNQSRKDRCT